MAKVVKKMTSDFNQAESIGLLFEVLLKDPNITTPVYATIQQLQSVFSGGGSADGGVLESIAAMDAAAQGKFYGVQLPDIHPELNMDHFALICIRGGANDELVQVAIGFDDSMKIYLRGGEINSYSAFSQISGGGGIGTETDPVFTAWLATNPISHFFANNTLEFATADLLDDLFMPGDYGIHINGGFNGKTNMNLTVKFASNDGTGGDGDQDYFQIIKFDTGEEFIRKYEHVTGGGNWSAWSSKIALQSWVTENFALKESGVVPPVSEDVILITAAPSYTVVPETADNINVSSTATVGTIVLNVLAADKALKISIKAGSNAVTIAGTAYNAGVVVFAVFTESTGTWSVDSTLDPVIPDYSDIKVQKRTTTAPQQMQFSYVISGFPAGGGSKGHLIFIDIPGSAFSGVYSSLVNFAGTTTYAQKIIEGTALNVVRVGAGAVYHSEYDGVNLASLKFSIISDKENTGVAGALVSQLIDGATDDTLKKLQDKITTLSSLLASDYQKKTDNSLATTDKTVVGAINEVNTKVTGSKITVTYTAAFTLSVGDKGKVIIVNSASDMAITIPAGLTAGSFYEIWNKGAGIVSFVAGSGNIINSADSRLKIRGQYCGAYIYIETTNITQLSGDIVL